MEIKKILEKFKIENNSYIFLIILVGVVFMITAGSFENNDKKTDVKQTSANMLINDEEKLEKILSKIEGVGRVSVMVTYRTSAQFDIAYETNSSASEREDGAKGKLTEENIDKKAVMSSGDPFVTRQLYPDIKGVVIVADGANDIKVKQKLIEAAATAMGVAQHKVCVAERSK